MKHKKYENLDVRQNCPCACLSSTPLSHWGMEIQLHAFLTSVLDRGEWTKSPDTHCIGGWVDPRIGLDSAENKSLLASAGYQTQILRSSNSQFRENLTRELRTILWYKGHFCNRVLRFALTYRSQVFRHCCWQLLRIACVRSVLLQEFIVDLISEISLYSCNIH
jgi:hypothetical protein